MRRTLVAAILLLAAASAFFLLTQPRAKTVSISAPNGALSCEVADSFESRAAGLSNRSLLCPDCCMLFSFKEEDRHGFWMKDMRFALDMVFLDSSGSVVAVVENAQPCPPAGACPIHYPEPASRHVVEVNAGRARELGLALGASVSGLGG